MLVAVFVAEIVLTLTDFVVEIAVRKQLGDVYAGERVTHAVMGILYGAMVANLIPVLASGGRSRRRSSSNGPTIPASCGGACS